MTLNRLLAVLICFGCVGFCRAQKENISVIDFVQIVKNNKEEALFYYEHNWRELREKALDKGYIESFDFLVTNPNEKGPFTYMLVTTFKNKEQFDLKEQYFKELIQEKGPIKLLNELQPVHFRKTLFSKVVTSLW
ncbi:hypothetical protein MWU59_10490 [Flavobacteriaceae bacterium F08102]|nr:hypothetical protein [Flavobacteriaceae bacterium F08102]